MINCDGGGADKRHESRRRQIIDAAIRCFRKNGFHAASMASLAKEAGMSVGHIYHYFENKEAIIAAFIEDGIEGFRGYMEQMQAYEGSFVDAMVEQADFGFEDMCDPDRASIVRMPRSPRPAAAPNRTPPTVSWPGWK